MILPWYLYNREALSVLGIEWFILFYLLVIQSCLNLKNYEAALSIYKGLTTDSVRGAISGTWRVYYYSNVIIIIIIIIIVVTE